MWPGRRDQARMGCRASRTLSPSRQGMQEREVSQEQGLGLGQEGLGVKASSVPTGDSQPALAGAKETLSYPTLKASPPRPQPRLATGPHPGLHTDSGHSSELA